VPLRWAVSARETAKILNSKNPRFSTFPLIFAVMAMLSYFIWNGSPEIFSVGSFVLRWYGLFFALGFLISQQILYYMYEKEGKPLKDVDTLTIYMVVATIIGARLGHVIFYQPDLILDDPLTIFLPFEFSPFRFTGLQGLASHGGAIGILFALWLYSRKKKPGQNYFQVLDRIVILVALTGALIRFGNYFNSEIIGKPTDSPTGVVFVNKLSEALEDREADDQKIVESVAYHRNDSLPVASNGRVPLSIYIFFKAGVSDHDAMSTTSVAGRLLANNLYEFFDQGEQLDYEIVTQKNGNLAARINTFGIARHPAQLYESISCVLLFLLLFWIWWKQRENLPGGRLFGIFLIVCFGLRFLYEFLKENQVSFEDEMSLNMGQILSIPLIIAGIFVLMYSYRKRVQTPQNA
jgi:phosphatidylglycerol---prolipoprotein diacylglyceryl transferase